MIRVTFSRVGCEKEMWNGEEAPMQAAVFQFSELLAKLGSRVG